VRASDKRFSITGIVNRDRSHPLNPDSASKKTVQRPKFVSAVPIPRQPTVEA
jgi:hypothetical protein